MATKSSQRGEATRETIKLAARRLFAMRGVHGVTTREIVAATGQKNGGSLHYYFRTKEMLVRELIVDGARIIDDRRNERLDRLERQGGPTCLRQVLEILVWPATDLGEQPGQEDSYIRFIAGLNLQDRELLDEVLSGKWNSGYQRCLAHIRRLAADVPADVLRQRLVFLSISLRSIMAARESALDHRTEHRRFWTSEGTMDTLLATLEAMILGIGERR
ncbi:MAG: helix-turn-helix domain-containing protein [Sphingobium sp.]|nr:helix-turn-helix domain-containing protein [Sphingobium sp.]